jgi:hypothetical protein
VYDAIDDAAATEQNGVFPFSGSEYLRQQCLSRRLDAPPDPRSGVGDDDDDDSGQFLDAASGSTRPLAFTFWRKLVQRMRCRHNFVRFTADALRRVHRRNPLEARRLLNVGPFTPTRPDVDPASDPDAGLEVEAWRQTELAESADFEDCIHRLWHARTVTNTKRGVGIAMLSMWIPEENGQQYLSELGASLDAISRQEVRDRHVAVTLEEMGKRSGDPASFTPLLDRQFKDFIERGHDELSTMPTPSRRRRESEFPLLSDDEQTSESDDEADSVSSTQTYKEAQLVRVLTGGVRRNPTRACADLPPGTYALADATLRHILDDSAFDRSEMQKVLLSQNSLSYNDDNHAIEDLYACEGDQLQLYRDSSHRILHAFGPYSQEDRERFVQTPEVQARDGCTTRCTVCYGTGATESSADFDAWRTQRDFMANAPHERGKGPLLCCDCCLHTVHAGCIGKKGTHWAHATRNWVRHPDDQVRCGFCDSNRNGGIAYDYGMDLAKQHAATKSVGYGYASAQRKAAQDAAKEAQAGADNTGKARPTTAGLPAGAEIGPDSEETAAPTQRPAEFEQASSFETVVISTVSVCPHASQLLATAMPMDLQREDLMLDETGRAALATPVLCRFSTEYEDGQWQAGEYGRLAADRERPRVLKELAKSGHYTEAFTARQELNSCLLHVGYVSASPEHDGPHPGKHGHRLSIWSVDHRLRTDGATRNSLFDAPVAQWPHRGDSSRLGPHWRKTPFLVSASGLRPLGAERHLDFLQDAGVDTMLVENWLAQRSTVEIVDDAPLNHVGPDDEEESGADYFELDEDDAPEGPTRPETGQPSPPAATSGTAGTGSRPAEQLDDLQRPDRVDEPIWTVLIHLATVHLQSQETTSPDPGAVPAAAFSATHLVSELLTRYNHDAGTAALAAVSTHGAQLWSQLGRHTSIPQLGSASPIAPVAPRPSPQALPRVFSNEDSPAADSSDMALLPNSLSPQPANIVGHDDASILMAALARISESKQESFPLSVQIDSTETAVATNGKDEDLGPVTEYNVDDSMRRADEVPHAGHRGLILFIIPSGHDDGNFKYAVGNGMFITTSLDNPRIICSIKPSKGPVTYYHVDKQYTWQYKQEYAHKRDRPYEHLENTLTLPVQNGSTGASTGGGSHGPVSGAGSDSMSHNAPNQGTINFGASSSQSPRPVPGNGRTMFDGREYHINNLGATEMKKDHQKTLAQLGADDLNTTTRDETGQHIKGQSTCKGALKHLLLSGLESVSKDTRDLHRGRLQIEDIKTRFITAATDGRSRIRKCLHNHCFQKWFVQDFYPAIRSLPLALYSENLYTVLMQESLPSAWVAKWNAELQDHQRNGSVSVVAGYAAPEFVAKLASFENPRVLPFGQGTVALAELCYYMLDHHTSKHPKAKDRVAAVKKMDLFKRYPYQTVSESANDYTLRLKRIKEREERDNVMLGIPDSHFKAVWFEGLCNPARDTLVYDIGDPEWEDTDLETMIKMAITADARFEIEKTKVLCEGSKWTTKPPGDGKGDPKDSGGGGGGGGRYRRRPAPDKPAVQEIEEPEKDATKIRRNTTIEAKIGPAVFKATKVYKDKTCLPCNKLVCKDLVCNVPECVARYQGTPSRYHNKAGCYIYCVQNGGVMDQPGVKDLAEGVQWAMKAYHDQLRESPFGKDNPMNDKLIRDNAQKEAGISFEHVRPTAWVSSARAKQLGATKKSTVTIEEVDSDESE